MTTLHALPTGVRGRVLALAVAILAVLVLWLGVAAPLLGWYDARAETLRRQQAIEQRMAALVQTLPALQAAAEAAAARGAARRETTLDGASDAVAAAALQQRLDEMAGQAGLRIGSAEVMPSEPAAGAFHPVAVRLTISAPWPALVRLLQATAVAGTPMLVDNLQIRSLGRDPNAKESPVEVTFTVIGYRAGPAPGAGDAAVP